MQLLHRTSMAQVASEDNIRGFSEEQAEGWCGECADTQLVSLPWKQRTTREGSEEITSRTTVPFYWLQL